MKALYLATLYIIFVSAATPADTIKSAFERFDWEANPPFVVARQDEMTKYFVAITLGKDAVVPTSTLTFGIGLNSSHDRVWPLVGNGWGSSYGHSGTRTARLKSITNDGFVLVISATWMTKREEGEFQSEFTCRWISEQTFEKEGFHVSVVISEKEKTTEQGATGNVYPQFCLSGLATLPPSIPPRTPGSRP